jgi:hypothetical protein
MPMERNIEFQSAILGGTEPSLEILAAGNLALLEEPARRSLFRMRKVKTAAFLDSIQWVEKFPARKTVLWTGYSIPIEKEVAHATAICLPGANCWGHFARMEKFTPDPGVMFGTQ